MFGRNTFNVFLYEIKKTIRKKGFLFTLFGLPLIGMAIFFFILRATGGDPTRQLLELEIDLQGIQNAGYVDETGQFSDPGEFTEGVTRRFDTIDEAADALGRGEIDIYFVVPSNYFDEGAIRLYVPRFAFSLLTDAPMRLLFYARLLDDGMDIDTLTRIAVPMEVDVLRIEATTDDGDAIAQTEEQQTALVNIMAILLVLTLFSTNGYMMQSVIEEKSSRLVEILIASVRPTQLLAGKILALGVLGLLIVTVYVITLLFAINLAGGSGTFLDGLSIPPDLLLIALAYYLLGYLLYSAIFGGIGAISTTMNEGSSLLSIFIIIIVFPYIFSNQFVTEPNGLMAVAFSMFPLTAPLAMIMRASVIDVPLIEYVISLALLGGAAFMMLWMAGRLFRVQSLLSGKMPKIRELPRMIFSGG